MRRVASRVDNANRIRLRHVSLALLVAIMGLAPRTARSEAGEVVDSSGAVNPPDQPPPAYSDAPVETAYQAPPAPLPPPPPPAPPPPATLALQGFFVAQKVMPGLALRLGKYWGPRFEASFIWTTQSVAPLGSFLGNQFALYLEGTPVRSSWFELNGGLGADIYYLWGIHGDLTQISLSAEANLSCWFTPRLGALLGVRGYPLHTSGLELGTRRDGSTGSPVLISVGIEWRTR